MNLTIAFLRHTTVFFTTSSPSEDDDDDDDDGLELETRYKWALVAPSAAIGHNERPDKTAVDSATAKKLHTQNKYVHKRNAKKIRMK